MSKKIVISSTMDKETMQSIVSVFNEEFDTSYSLDKVVMNAENKLFTYNGEFDGEIATETIEINSETLVGLIRVGAGLYKTLKPMWNTVKAVFNTFTTQVEGLIGKTTVAVNGKVRKDHTIVGRRVKNPDGTRINIKCKAETEAEAKAKVDSYYKKLGF